MQLELALAVDMQGIETVRRDNCLLVKNVVTISLEMILMQRDEVGAQAYVRNTIADLLMNRMDLSLLVITKVRTLSLAWPYGKWSELCLPEY